MTPEEYLTERLEDQITWYDAKSGNNKRNFGWLRSIELIAAASIPFLVGYVAPDQLLIPLVIGLLGVLITICAGATALFQFQENWIEYRTTAESLKKEKFLFLTKVEPYDNEEDAFPTLVQRVETLVSKENTNWAQYMMKPGEDQKHGS